MSRRLEAAEYDTSLYEGIVLLSKCGQQKSTSPFFNTAPLSTIYR